MQHLEVSGAVRPPQSSLGVRRLTIPVVTNNWKSMDVTMPFIMLSSEH